MILCNPPSPAALVLDRDQVQPRRHRIGHRLQIRIRPARDKGLGNRRLLHDVPRIMRRERLDDPLRLPRFLDDAHQVRAHDLLARTEPEHRILGSLRDQVILQRGLVLEVNF